MSTAKPPTSRRAGLDHDDIVDAALALVERAGGSALSMRRLASDLGVAPTTIYWHVGGRDELIQAIIERVSTRYATFEPSGRTPRSRVLSAARQVWTSALEDRHVTSLANQVGATSLLALPLEVALARELEAAGLRGRANRDALRAILMCVGGFLVVAFRSTGSESDGSRVRAHDLWADVDPAHLSPATLAAHREPPDLPALFERTLGSVVDSLLPRSPRRTSHD